MPDGTPDDLPPATEAPPLAGASLGRVRIRLASSPSDVEAMIRLARMAHEESAFRGIPIDDAKAQRLTDAAMADKGRYGLLIAEKDGEITGMLIATAGEYFFSKAVMATALIWYVAPKHRGGTSAVKLLHGFRKWAQNRGAVEAQINVTSGVRMASTDKMLKRVGLRPVGGNYSLKLQGKKDLTGRA